MNIHYEFPFAGNDILRGDLNISNYFPFKEKKRGYFKKC